MVQQPQTQGKNPSTDAACLTAGLDYLARGWSVLAVCPPDHFGVGSTHRSQCKSPGKAPFGKWKCFQDRLPTPEEIKAKWRDNPQLNVGMALGPVSGLIRVDVDGPEGERRLAQLSGGDLPATLEFTSGRPNGGRGLLYKIPPGATLRTTAESPKKKEELRLQAKGAQTVLPPSRHREGSLYAWKAGHGPDEIQAALAPAWLVEQLRPAPQRNGHTAAGQPVSRLKTLSQAEARAVAYLKNCPPAVSGNGGHNQTFAVARAIIWGFDLGPDAGFKILLEHYNPRCDPPWSDAELRHKCRQADTRPFEKPRGYLLRPDFQNYVEREVTEEDGKKTTIKLGLAVGQLADNLFQLTDGWPKRIGNILFARGPDHQPLWLEGTDEVFAWVGGRLGGQGGNPIRWAKGADKVTQGQFAAYLRQSAEDYDAVEAFPHEPAMRRTYYLHPEPRGGDGKALAELRARFRPATLVDGDLIRAFFLSLLWGGPPGQRPAWLFTALDDDAKKGRGVGKSTLVKVGARLIGGHVDGSPNEPMEKLVTRLLSAEGLGRRVVLLDNLKTLRFSWAELEGLITNDVVSGHRLYAGEGRRPNTLTYCLTLNGATLSRDMAQRCVIVRLARPDHNADWEAATAALVDKKRWEIIGDILADLRAKAPPLAAHTRWAAWEDAILARVGDPSECQKVIAERQEEVDDDMADEILVREEFIQQLRNRGFDPEQNAVRFLSKEAAVIVNGALDESRPVNKATAHLRTLHIDELRESRRGYARGWAWRGKKTPPDASCLAFADVIPR
jgi:hypothetical protein